MLDGFAFLVTEVGVLLLASAGLGALAGRFLWPGRRAPSRRTEPLRPTAPTAPPPRAAVAVAPLPSPTETPDGPDPAVADLERRLRASRAEVLSLQAEALNLKAAVNAVADRKDAEMGRLETAAIEALDSLIASHERSMNALEEEGQAATAAARRHERDLEDERRRALRLQAALMERDERVAALLEQVAERDRRIEHLTARPAHPSS